MTKDDRWWRHHFSNATWVQFTHQKQNEEQVPYLRFYCYYIDFKLRQICYGDKKITSMTPSWQSHDLDTIYRPDRKWGPDFVSQVLYDIRFESMTSSWCSRDLSTICRPDRKWDPDFISQFVHVTWVQFTDQIENETQILHLKFYMGYWLQTLSDMLGWQKNYIHDIIMVVTWLDTIYRSERK